MQLLYASSLCVEFGAQLSAFVVGDACTLCQLGSRTLELVSQRSSFVVGGGDGRLSRQLRALDIALRRAQRSRVRLVRAHVRRLQRFVERVDARGGVARVTLNVDQATFDEALLGARQRLGLARRTQLYAISARLRQSGVALADQLRDVGLQRGDASRLQSVAFLKLTCNNEYSINVSTSRHCEKAHQYCTIHPTKQTIRAQLI